MNNIIRYADFESRIVSIDYIVNYSKKSGFNLPGCQREKEWLNNQNEKFILSILENKPLGSFIFNKRHDKTFILDGQHRINSLELFTRDNFGVKIGNSYIFYDGTSLNARKIIANTNKKVIGLTDEEKRDLLDTEIFIREYNNLSDDEMGDIIDSINEGIKNDNVNVKKDINNLDKIEILLNDCSNIIFNKEFEELKDNLKIDVKKYVGYVGTIIDNFDNNTESNNYTQLNAHHVKRFYNNLKKEKEIDFILKEIKKFIKIIFSEEFLNNKDIIKITDKYELNNYYINCIFYKLYEKYNEDSDNLIKHSKKYKNILEELIEKYYGTHFKELLECFDNLYQEILF